MQGINSAKGKEAESTHILVWLDLLTKFKNIFYENIKVLELFPFMCFTAKNIYQDRDGIQWLTFRNLVK